MNMKTLSRTLLIITTLALVGCRPEAPATKYNQLISVPDADNASYQTNEDEALVIQYELSPEEQSIDLAVEIEKGPRYGKLEDCVNSEAMISCKYVPKKDFYGDDSIVVRSKDGGIYGEKAGILDIKVMPVPDSPRAGLGQSESIIKNNGLSFQVSSASDIDTAQAELNYVVVNNPQNGTLSDCFPDKGLRSCVYTPDVNFVGNDEFTYKIVDEAGMESQVVKVLITIGDQFFTTEEVFTQNAQGSDVNGFDLIWVIDNSGSMDDEQDELAANTESFIQAFVDSNIAQSDFKMAVTTTEAWYNDAQTFREDVNGNVYDFSKASLEANKQGFIDNFKAAVQIGNTARYENGSQIEKTFASMERVYAQNAGWFGDDKKALLFIFLTDEREQSDSKLVANWLAQFDGLKTRSDLVKMFPIYNPGSDTDGKFAATRTHYNVPEYNILNSFDSILDNITLNITNLLSGFSLEDGRVVDENTVEVFVNNVKVPRVNGNNEVQWTLNGNSVSFTNAPKAGATIKVKYKYSVNI
jgi:hypothetical protein